MKNKKINSSLLNLNEIDSYSVKNHQAVYLTENSFAYDFLEFKYDNKKHIFELKNIHHVGVKNFLASQGIFKRYLNKNKAIIIKQKDCFIEEISSENAKDVFQKYVFSFEENFVFTYQDKEYSIPAQTVRNIFLKQSNLFFNERWMEHLEEHTIPLLKDTKKYCYFVFNNAFVQISKKDKIESFPLALISEKCIWASQRINRDFRKDLNFKDNPFVKFFRNVTRGIEKRDESLMSAFGYLLHNYFSPADGKAVFLYDEALTDKFKPMGGTGKGLCANALAKMRACIKIDGKNLDMTNRFRFELIKPGTQIAWIDETRPDFKFESLFSCLTDGWTVERKYLPQFFIAPEDSPKVLICSNTIITNVGSSFKRRQFIVELNDYYSKKIMTGHEKPIEDEHGILFGEQWSQSDWDQFHTFMMTCVQFYFENGLVGYELKNVTTNLLQQKTSEDFVEWCNDQNFQVGNLYNNKALFDDYISRYFESESDFKQRKFTNWLKFYGSAHSLKYINQSSNGESKFMFE